MPVIQKRRIQLTTRLHLIFEDVEVPGRSIASCRVPVTNYISGVLCAGCIGAIGLRRTDPLFSCCVAFLTLDAWSQKKHVAWKKVSSVFDRRGPAQKGGTMSHGPPARVAGRLMGILLGGIVLFLLKFWCSVLAKRVWCWLNGTLTVKRRLPLEELSNLRKFCIDQSFYNILHKMFQFVILKQNWIYIAKSLKIHTELLTNYHKTSQKHGGTI